MIDYFWPTAILKKDFLQRFLAKQLPNNSVDKFFRNILMLYTEKCVSLYATREMMT